MDKALRIPKKYVSSQETKALVMKVTQAMVTSNLLKKKHQKTRRYQEVVQCNAPEKEAGEMVQSLWKDDTCLRKMLELASLHCLRFYQSRSSQMLEHINIKVSQCRYNVVGYMCKNGRWLLRC